MTKDRVPEDESEQVTMDYFKETDVEEKENLPQENLPQENKNVTPISL